LTEIIFLTLQNHLVRVRSLCELIREFAEEGKEAKILTIHCLVEACGGINNLSSVAFAFVVAEMFDKPSTKFLIKKKNYYLITVTSDNKMQFSFITDQKINKRKTVVVLQILLSIKPFVVSTSTL